MDALFKFTVTQLLEIPFFRLEVCLWVKTCRTCFRGSFACVNITAVSALPLNSLISLKYFTSLNSCKQSAVSLLMHSLNFSNLLESNCYLREALFNFTVTLLLEIPFLWLKVCLWVKTSRTSFWSCFACVYVTAVTALPLNLLISLKYLTSLNST